MAKRIKVDITDEQFKQAISWLDNKGTKKGACEILGVSNNKTMETRIQEWKDKQVFDAEMRKKKRRTACSPEEMVAIIEAYLDGYTFEELSDRFYRSTTYIKHRLELAGSLIRVHNSVDKLFPPMLPEECVNFDGIFRVRETFKKEVKDETEYAEWRTSIIAEHGKDILEVFKRAGKFDTTRAIHVTGQKVWVPAYQCLGEVLSEVPTADGIAYKVYLLDADNHRTVYVPSYDLGDLSHLQAIGVNIDVLGSFSSGINCTEILNKALAAARKNKD